MTEEILYPIAQGGIAFSFLIAAVVYFLKKIKIREEEIQELNKVIRDIEKDNLTTLYKVISLLEQNAENDKNKTDLFIRELELVRKSIESKIDGLKK